ncbi:hypothetical protein [Arthrobacter sp. Rue61a]|uniref:hypothetical protein n=1 Tax=Arthrobacter sp. Rue61a TaxID=1118963 RepID=UPI000319E75E|nr:hypothetical protein [Arthrobacter sp. Rue61a]
MNEDQLDEALRRADPASQWAMAPETTDGITGHLRAMESSRKPSSKGRRRRWIAFLLAGVTCLGGVGVAAPAVANFMGFLAEDVENPPPVPTAASEGPVRNEAIPHSEWINPLASDYVEFAKTKYASLPLPPRYNEAGLKDASALKEADMYRANDQGDGIITQDIAPTVRYEHIVRCLWQKEWLDQHEQGNVQGQAAAVTVLRQSLAWPATVATDGGGVVERMTVTVSAAETGNAEQLEEDHWRLGCQGMIKGLEQ